MVVDEVVGEVVRVVEEGDDGSTDMVGRIEALDGDAAGTFGDGGVFVAREGGERGTAPPGERGERGTDVPSIPAFDDFFDED